MTLVLWGWSAFSGVANTVNACNPGWCGRYGFPLAFYTWSDAVILFNGERPSPFHPAALVFDILVVLAVAAGIVLRRW